MVKRQSGLKTDRSHVVLVAAKPSRAESHAVAWPALITNLSLFGNVGLLGDKLMWFLNNAYIIGAKVRLHKMS